MDYRDISPTIAEVARNYHYQKPPDLFIYVQDLVEKLLRLLGDLLSSLRIFMPGMADTHMVGNVMQIVLFVAGLLAVLAIVYFAYRRLTQIRDQSLLAKRGQLGAETMLDASGWRSQAEQLSSQQQWRQACRALYFSLLRSMAEKEVLEFVPTRTNYEYWYALTLHKPLALVFRQIADIVEVSWFGHHEATKSDYDQCLNLLQQAEAEINAKKVAVT
jgi:hypothetical protein